jgi:hypothetical protein
MMSDGATKLDEDDVPKHLCVINNELMSLRRFAHHESHDSIETKIDVEFEGAAFP